MTDTGSEIPQEVSIIIATYGDQSWGERAFHEAYPSADAAARRQWGLDEVVVRHLPDGTLAQARNTAAAFATKQWLCFLDADDKLEPNYALAMAPAMWSATHYWQTAIEGYEGHWGERVPMKLLAPAVSYVDAKGRESTPAIPNKGRWPDMNECVIGTLLPRFMFQVLEGFRELPSLEDYDLWLRCVKGGATIDHVEDAVYLAAAGHRRNADQSCYQQLREEHAAVWST